MVTYKDMEITPNGSQIKTLKVLFCKSNSYPSALVGIELIDPFGKSIL